MDTDIEEEQQQKMETEMMVVNADVDYEHLGHLATYARIAEKSFTMKHGEIVAMLNWLGTQGKARPEWGFKKLFGKIPIPYVALVSVIVLLGTFGRFPMRYSVGLGIITALLVLAVTFNLTEYTHDKSGLCIVCGQPAHPKWKKAIQVFDRKGKPQMISRSGYCDPCAWNVHRWSLWHTVEQQVWLMIQTNPTRTPNILRRIGYKLLWTWPFYYREKFTDPRPVGTGHIYTLKQRAEPTDLTTNSRGSQIEAMGWTLVKLGVSMQGEA